MSWFAALAKVAGIGGKLMGARENTRNLLQEGRELEIQADIEELNAKFVENDLRADLLRTLASNNVAMGPGGLGGGPSAEASLSEDLDASGRQVRNVRLDSMLKAGALRRGARAKKKEAKTSVITGLLNSVGGSAESF